LQRHVWVGDENSAAAIYVSWGNVIAANWEAVTSRAAGRRVFVKLGPPDFARAVTTRDLAHEQVPLPTRFVLVDLHRPVRVPGGLAELVDAEDALHIAAQRVEVLPIH